MLRVTIEYLPVGDETRKKIIATGIIYNDATGTEELGNYHAELFDEDCHRWGKTGLVKKFPRLKLTAWDLLYRILKKIVEKHQ